MSQFQGGIFKKAQRNLISKLSLIFLIGPALVTRHSLKLKTSI